MNIEEALIKYNEIDKRVSIKPFWEVRDIIEDLGNQIEEIKSRTCSNCEYWHQKYLCLEIGNGTFKTESNFGCTLFKRMENKNEI